MQHHFVINPAAGQGHATEYIPKIKAYFEGKDDNYTIYTSTGVRDATNYIIKTAKSTTEELRFYACGGDGTLSEVVRGAIGFNHVSVGVIPAGTGNDFVRSFDKPEAFHDIEAQVKGHPEAIDVIQINDHYSINMANIGFDCDAAAAASKLKTKPLIKGPMAYVGGLIQEFCKEMGYELTFTIDGTETIQGKYLLCTVANGSFCGGGWHSSPRAHMNDGLLELAIVKNLPRRKLLPIIPSYHSGKYLDKHIKTGVVTYRQCKTLNIVAAKPQNVSIDGEIVPFTVLAIQNLPGALRIVVPAGTNFKNP